MIEARRRPGVGGVAALAAGARGDVARGLGARNHPVVAADTGAPDLGVIHRPHRQPGERRVTALTGVGGGEVSRRLAAAARGGVTADTGGPGDGCMIERRAGRGGRCDECRCRRPGARGGRCARTGGDARAALGGGGDGRRRPRPHRELVTRAMATRSAAIPAGVMAGAGSHPQPHARVGLPGHAVLVAAHARHRGHVRVLHDRAGERREHGRRVAQLAGELAGAVGRIGGNVSGRAGGRLLERRGRHVVEAQPVGVALRAIAGDARMPDRTHHIQGVVAGGRVALRARRVGGNVSRRFGAAAHLIGGKRRAGRVAAVAVTAGRMGLVVCLGTGVAPGGRGAHHHPQIRRGLVTGRAGAHHRHGGVAGDAERRSTDTRRTDTEAPGVHVRGAVAARAVAIHAADRKVIARCGHDRDVGKGLRHRRTVAGEAPGHALVGAGDGVEREVARRRVALGAGRSGRNVIRRLAGGRQQVGRERGRRDVAVAAVAGGRMLRIQGGVRTGVSRRGRGAGDHSHIGRALVTGRARAHGCDRGVAGDVERRSTDIRRTDMEATGIHVRSAVAARAVAVGAPDRDVAGARPPHNRDRVAGRRSRERSGARAVAGDAPGHALVRAGNGIDRPVAGGGVALRAQRPGRNVVRRARHGGVEEGGRVMALAAIARGGVQAIELRRGTRVARGGIGARMHPLEVRGLVAARAGERGHRRVVDDAGVPRRVVGGRVAALARC